VIKTGPGVIEGVLESRKARQREMLADWLLLALEKLTSVVKRVSALHVHALSEVAYRGFGNAQLKKSLS